MQYNSIKFYIKNISIQMKITMLDSFQLKYIKLVYL